MKHTWVQHENCSKLFCPICDRSLGVCSVCGLTKGSLTTDCPGAGCWTEKSRDIYDGKIDFKDGKWVNDSSPHCPQAHQYYHTLKFEK